MKFDAWTRVGRRWMVPVAMILGAALAGGCVSEPSAVTGERRSYGYSWQQELQLGKETDTQITQQMGLYENEAIQRYVDEVGRRVVAQSELAAEDAPELYQDTQFTFRVLDSPVVNAFALPGGFVYVTRGLMTHLQNEAQLAVVLGHEVGHVVARHASQQAWRSQLGQLGVVAGAVLGQAVFGGEGRDIASNVLNLGGGAVQALMFKYSREAEHESDSLGVRYAAGAGYATAEGAAFFNTLERLSAQEGRALPTWSSTHPDPGDRAGRVRELSGAYTPIGGGDDRVVGTEEYLRRLEGMVLGENPREGFRRGDLFLHPELAFQLPVPTGWRLQNERAVVLMADPQGQAMIAFQLVPVASPREAVPQLVQETQLQVVSATDVQINGLPATVVVGQAQSQQGAVGVHATFVQHDGKVYSILGYTPAQIFPQARPVFEAVAGGFAPLRDRSVLNVQPTRLRVTRVERPAAFRELVPAVLPEGLTAEELAILNQVQLDERVPVGRWLKLPQ